MIRCRLFGIDIETDVPPPVVLASSGLPRLRISADPALVCDSAPVFATHMINPDGGGRYEVREQDGAWFVRLEPVVEARIADAEIRYRLLRPSSIDSLRWQLFGIVIALWLERVHCVVLHGATIDMSGTAVAFVGASGAGKSSLIAECVKRGYRVVGDDHVAVEGGRRLHVRPALPWLKLSHRAIEHLGGDPDTMPLLHGGNVKRRFDLPADRRVTRSLPIAAIYQLDREPGRLDASITRISSADVVPFLIRHSYAPRTMAATRVDAVRLTTLAQLAREVPIKILRFPDGFDYLADVVSAVESDVAADGCALEPHAATMVRTDSPGI